MQELNMELSSKFVYCTYRNCPKVECLRHNNKIKLNIVVLTGDYRLDKKCGCEMYLKEGEV